MYYFKKAIIMMMVSITSLVLGQDWTDDLTDRETFVTFSKIDDTPGSIGVRTMKFLVCGVDTTTPRIYFIDTNKNAYHYDFAVNALKLRISLDEFNRATYFTDHRSFIAGTLLSYDNFIDAQGKKGAYVFEFWPTDPVKVQFTHLVYELISTHMGFDVDRLFYHPAGETHMQLLKQEQEQYNRLAIPVLTSELLFQNMTFIPLHLGEGYGYLKVGDATNSASYSFKDIVIFKTIPNELSHVAGVLTEEPQTPLCHINLKARQNNTPNVFLKNASSQPEIEALIDKPVYFKVRADGIEIRRATDQEIEIHLEKIRPTESRSPERNLSITTITSLKQVRNKDISTFGAKAANVGELKLVALKDVTIPDGFAIPFYFYHVFMSKTGLYEEARSMIERADFKSSSEAREKLLKEFQKKIKKTPMPEDLQASIDELQGQFSEGIGIRCRSSSNNEDLPGFNGAGLYDSYTYRPGAGSLSQTIQKVFASLWNFRAFEEREFYRINHFHTAMGVLVHPNFDSEIANGVAVTKNPYYKDWDGCYINAQVGESLVTNPQEGSLPDEILGLFTQISNDDDDKEGLEIIFIRHSNQVDEGKTVLTLDQTKLLADNLLEIQKHFLKVYHKNTQDGFAMDIEFKIDKNNELVIKQARPWVD